MGVCGFCKGREKTSESKQDEKSNQVENKYEIIKKKIELELNHLHNDFRENIVRIINHLF
jgi:hypothetical protein